MASTTSRWPVINLTHLIGHWQTWQTSLCWVFLTRSLRTTYAIGEFIYLSTYLLLERQGSWVCSNVTTVVDCNRYLILDEVELNSVLLCGATTFYRRLACTKPALKPATASEFLQPNNCPPSLKWLSLADMLGLLYNKRVIIVFCWKRDCIVK